MSQLVVFAVVVLTVFVGSLVPLSPVRGGWCDVEGRGVVVIGMIVYSRSHERVG